MTQIKRRSPVSFKADAARIEERNGFQVAVEYYNEGREHIVDLSHLTKWDVQARDLSGYRPMGVEIPLKPLESILKNKILINRMNNTQASVWHILGDDPKIPDDPGYTDVTDSSASLAIIGENVSKIAEKLSYLNLFDPKKATPFLTQGPFAHVACQIVSFNKDGCVPGILLTCIRGYARDVVDVVMNAGNEFGLKPAGISKFNYWIETYFSGIV